jgi:hypothetical protein
MTILLSDDFLPPGMADAVERLFTSPAFPWHYYLNVNYPSPPPEGHPGVFQNDGRFRDASGFSTLIFPSPTPPGPGFEPAKQVLEAFLNKHRVTPQRLIRVKANLLTRAEVNSLPFTPHVDLPTPHCVLIYYVTDSDGDTLLLDKTYPDWASATVMRAISPRKGRAVLFDGRHYHTGTRPERHDHRIVLNYDFL